MKRHYHYLVAGLQDLSLDIQKLTFNQLAFREELRSELHPSDYKLMELLFLPFDNDNLLNLLTKAGKDHNDKGIFSKKHLEENISEPHDLPAYMMRFIVAYKKQDPVYPDMKPENELNTLFYDEMLASAGNDFLRDWFEFEMNVNNIVLAFNARKYKMSYSNQVVGSTEISESIKRSHARDFGIGNDCEYIEELTAIMRKEDIKKREQAVDELKWKYLDDATFFHYFTIEKILAFIIKLGMIERWLGIDDEHSNEMFKKLLKELQASYELPESFTDK